MSNVSKTFGADFPPQPQVDFAQFGPVEMLPVPRIQRFVAGVMARNWATIPHVTQHDDADITVLETTRKQLAAERALKVTPLAFFVKAVADVLRLLPQFNSSLDTGGNNVLRRGYVHIGIAVDTPGGLLVPVLRDCDRKSLLELAREIEDVSTRAREKGLPMAEMVGGCFTISSLGGIGGTGFTPIINAPEVAILGISKAAWKPRRGDDDAIDWRLMLPLSLSYDHRLINGADAARFCVAVSQALAEPRRWLSDPHPDHANAE